MYKRYRIRSYERGFKFYDGDFVEILHPGIHWILDPRLRTNVDVRDVRVPVIAHDKLDVIARSGALDGEAEVIDLKDTERGLLWVDGRFDRILGKGLHAVWTVFNEVKVERVGIEDVRFFHPKLQTVLTPVTTHAFIEQVTVADGCIGLFYLDGKFRETLVPGLHAFWKGNGRVTVKQVDMREAVLDVAGQEILTADHVSLRLNAIVTYKVRDAIKAVNESTDYAHALYREMQLALRALIGTRTLDTLLGEKDGVAAELHETVRTRAADLGLEVISTGIRDIILPGEMKTLLNRVVEAQKAAEANLITRREETASIRSQLNSARLLESNPTLLRLRELETLEKVAEKTNLQVVLGDEGLAERVLKLI